MKSSVSSAWARRGPLGLESTGLVATVNSARTWPSPGVSISSARQVGVHRGAGCGGQLADGAGADPAAPAQRAPGQFHELLFDVHQCLWRPRHDFCLARLAHKKCLLCLRTSVSHVAGQNSPVLRCVNRDSKGAHMTLRSAMILYVTNHSRVIPCGGICLPKFRNLKQR